MLHPSQKNARLMLHPSQSSILPKAPSLQREGERERGSEGGGKEGEVGRGSEGEGRRGGEGESVKGEKEMKKMLELLGLMLHPPKRMKKCSPNAPPLPMLHPPNAISVRGSEK